jgi:hypothetical protein
MSRSRSYHELRRLPTFEERFDYLNLKGYVGESTLGFDRWIGQRFYQSREWRICREAVIVRDNGCDLGVPGYEIFTEILIHHMNPISVRDIRDDVEGLLDPEFLITTTKRTHNAIHYGDRRLVSRRFVERKRNDTKLW